MTIKVILILLSRLFLMPKSVFRFPNFLDFSEVFDGLPRVRQVELQCQNTPIAEFSFITFKAEGITETNILYCHPQKTLLAYRRWGSIKLIQQSLGNHYLLCKIYTIYFNTYCKHNIWKMYQLIHWSTIKLILTFHKRLCFVRIPVV